MHFTLYSLYIENPIGHRVVPPISPLRCTSAQSSSTPYVEPPLRPAKHLIHAALSKNPARVLYAPVPGKCARGNYKTFFPRLRVLSINGQKIEARRYLCICIPASYRKTSARARIRKSSGRGFSRAFLARHTCIIYTHSHCGLFRRQCGEKVHCRSASVSLSLAMLVCTLDR